MSTSVTASTYGEISCIYQNVRGLNTKTVEFYKSVCNCDCDIIAITESWLQSNTFSTELFDDSYSVFRCDRDLSKLNVKRGGGVMLAVKEKYKPTPMDLQVVHDNTVKIDIVGCNLTVDCIKLCVFVIYIPPNVSSDELSIFFEHFESLYHLYDTKMLMVGDFNLPNLYDNSNDHRVELFKNFSDLFALRQLNNIKNINNRILDLILSNITCTVSRESIPLVPEDEHHPSLNISFYLSIDKKHCFPVNLSQFKYNFRKANFPLLYDHILKTDWADLYVTNNVDAACDVFYNILYHAVDMYVPRSKIHSRIYPIWFTSDIIKGVKRKYRLFKKFKKSKSQIHRDQYNQLRADLKRKIDTAHGIYMAKAENSISDDPSTFWSFVRVHNSSGILPRVLTDGDHEYSEPEDIVNAFADFFRSVYSTSCGHNRLAGEVKGSSHITLNFLTDDMITPAFKKLKNKLSFGPDNVPCLLVKDCAAALLRPLSFLFNLALKTNKFPRIWKEARISPIFKKGNANKICNYRPVSILSPFAKVFEMAIYDQVFLQVRQIILQAQHGFFANRGTLTNLASFTEFAANALDRRKQVDTIYTDFSKAFDRVDHSILLPKLEKLGFGSDLLLFLESYLENRVHYVEVRGYKSYKFKATSGAPQGSHLAPLIFSLFINDINVDVSSEILLFADDLKLFRVVDGIGDCIALQRDLKAIDEWCDNNNLPLNIGKCFTVTYSNKLSAINFNYKLNNTVIERSMTMKDLGITFDSKLSFGCHIEQIRTDALRMWGYILRNSKGFVNIQTYKILYYTYVRSKLEYGASVWQPIFNKYTTRLENIQRKFLKFLAFKTDGVYPPRGIAEAHLLERFAITSLDSRRKYFSLNFIFKLCRSIIDSPDLLSQIQFHVPARPTRSSPTFHLPVPATHYLYSSPLFQSMSLFNNVCNDVDINNVSLVKFDKIIKARLQHLH